MIREVGESMPAPLRHLSGTPPPIATWGITMNTWTSGHSATYPAHPRPHPTPPAPSLAIPGPTHPAQTQPQTRPRSNPKRPAASPDVRDYFGGRQIWVSAGSDQSKAPTRSRAAAPPRAATAVSSRSAALTSGPCSDPSAW